MRAKLILCMGLLVLTSCATRTTSKLENQFQTIGLSSKSATCMTDALEQRLSGDDLKDVSNYMRGLSRSDTAQQSLSALLKIKNARAALAMGQAGFSCVLNDFQE